MGDDAGSDSRAGVQEARITYVGHATVLMELNGMRVLTDPILRDRVSFLRRRKYGKLDPSVYQDIDAILLSHLHHDHLDPPSLKRVGVDTRLIAPLGSGDFLHGKGMRNVQEVHVGDVFQLGPLRIRVTYADHDPQRHPFGTKAECLGFVIEGDYSVYFPGDTDLFPEMADLAETLTVPPLRFEQHAAELAPDALVRIVKPGGSISLRQTLS